jgi:hypothetical protein
MDGKEYNLRANRRNEIGYIEEFDGVERAHHFDGFDGVQP